LLRVIELSEKHQRRTITQAQIDQLMKTEFEAFKNRVRARNPAIIF